MDTVLPSNRWISTANRSSCYELQHAISNHKDSTNLIQRRHFGSRTHLLAFGEEGEASLRQLHIHGIVAVLDKELHIRQEFGGGQEGRGEDSENLPGLVDD